METYNQAINGECAGVIHHASIVLYLSDTVNWKTVFLNIYSISGGKGFDIVR